MTQLIFVTRKDVVNIATKTMQNIPQKHIGVYQNGFVYNYSNGQDKVVRDTVSDFFARFQAADPGDQGLFFGEFPNTDLELSVDLTAGVCQPRDVVQPPPQGGRALVRSARRRFRVDGDSSWVNEIIKPAKNFFGLFHPVPSYYGPTYDARRRMNQLIDHWAYLLDVTAVCECKHLFNLINTYDRARFTFGFYQLAAHTPNDNLILLFRAALLDPDFQELFPGSGARRKVFRVAQDGTATDLEQETLDPASG